MLAVPKGADPIALRRPFPPAPNPPAAIPRVESRTTRPVGVVAGPPPENAIVEMAVGHLQGARGGHACTESAPHL